MITALYGLSFLAIWHGLVLYAAPPADDVPAHVPGSGEVAAVVGINIVVALASWVLTKKYTDSRLREAGVEP